MEGCILKGNRSASRIRRTSVDLESIHRRPLQRDRIDTHRRFPLLTLCLEVNGLHPGTRAEGKLRFYGIARPPCSNKIGRFARHMVGWTIRRRIIESNRSASRICRPVVDLKQDNVGRDKPPYFADLI